MLYNDAQQSALEVCSRLGAIKIHVYLYLYLLRFFSIQFTKRNWSRIFQSCISHPCIFGPAFSGFTFSGPAFFYPGNLVPHFSVVSVAL